MPRARPLGRRRAKHPGTPQTHVAALVADLNTKNPAASAALVDLKRQAIPPHFSNIIKVDLKAELFSYAIDEDALRLAEMMDGKLLVVTNVRDMVPGKVIERYKSLADIERGFKVLKSELEIGPVYHRLPERIRAHASICFMALILHRVMRMRLREGKTGLTPERALQSLKRIQHHRVSINGAPPLSGVSSMTAEHSDMLKALRVKTPSQSQQLSLL